MKIPKTSKITCLRDDTKLAMLFQYQRNNMHIFDYILFIHKKKTIYLARSPLDFQNFILWVVMVFSKCLHSNPSQKHYITELFDICAIKPVQ